MVGATMYDAKATAARVLAEYGAHYEGGAPLAARYNPGAKVGEALDCAVRALHIVSDMTYEQAHAKIAKDCNRKTKRGTRTADLFAMLSTLAPRVKLREPFSGEPLPTLARFIATHPRGVYYVTVRRHALALVDGKVIDSHATGLRCRVDGAWKFAD